MNFSEISLTNQIEIIKVFTLFGAGQNQFEMVRVPEDPTRIKDVVARYNIFDSTFITYNTLEILSDRIRVVPIPITNDLTQFSGQILFFVSRIINQPRRRLEERLLDIWQMRAGTIRIGDNSFPQAAIRFPFQMPSRGKIFR